MDRKVAKEGKAHEEVGAGGLSHGDRRMATLPGRLLAHASRTPDKVFLEVWDEQAGVTQRVTYRELADATLAAAAWLRGLRCGDGSFIRPSSSASHSSKRLL